MTDTDPHVLAYHVGRLDRADLRALVADLWRARGFETAVERGLVRATDGAGDTVHVAVGDLPADPPGDATVDVLVAPSTGGTNLSEDVRVLDAHDLAEMLRYAVGPAATRSLCERHLGASPEGLPASPATRLSRRAARARAVVERTPPALVLLAAVGLLALAGMAQLPGALDSGEAVEAGANVTTPAESATETPAANASELVPEVGDDWKSPPRGGFDFPRCGGPTSPPPEDLPESDCPVDGNGSVGESG